MMYYQILVTVAVVVIVCMSGVLTLFAMKTLRKMSDKLMELAEKYMEEE